MIHVCKIHLPEPSIKICDIIKVYFDLFISGWYKNCVCVILWPPYNGHWHDMCTEYVCVLMRFVSSAEICFSSFQLRLVCSVFALNRICCIERPFEIEYVDFRIGFLSHCYWLHFVWDGHCVCVCVSVVSIDRKNKWNYCVRLSLDRGFFHLYIIYVYYRSKCAKFVVCLLMTFG